MPVQSGDLILLLGPRGERHLVTAQSSTQRVPGLGVLDLGSFVGMQWGSSVPLGLAMFTLLRPSFVDYFHRLERKAQIITPKDASRILFETGLGAGDKVAEAGVGSGALTLALAHAVAPSGRVFAYDLRQEHLDVGRRNLMRTPWKDCVEFVQGDIHAGIPQRELDAFILDVPDPERGVETALASLRAGGVFAAYTPHVVQAQAVAQALTSAGFAQVRSLELLEREWAIGKDSSRPSFEMLGHTAFLTFARAPGPRT